jgi:predicted Zn-dependent protease
MSFPAAPDLSSVEQDINRLMQWQRAGRHQEALDGARAMLARLPGNSDLALLAAVSLRHLGRADEALETLDRIAVRRPRFSMLHQERALCHMLRRDMAGAIEALSQAVKINPASPAAWKMLEGLHRQAGDELSAASAAARVAELSRLPGPVLIAAALVADNHLGPAEDMVRGFLQQHGPPMACSMIPSGFSRAR